MKLPAFQGLLHFLYTGWVDLGNDMSLALELMIAATKYAAPQLKRFCELYIAEMISLQNIIEILYISELHQVGFLNSSLGTNLTNCFCVFSVIFFVFRLIY